MADKIKYMGINLPDSLVEELKVWKMAYSLSSGRNVSYAEMVQDMLGSLKVGNQIGRASCRERVSEAV